MAYNTKPMLTDANGKLIPQIYDPTTDEYKPLSTDVYNNINVNNFPPEQSVTGNVQVDNFPATQQVEGNVQLTGSNATLNTTDERDIRDLKANQPPADSVPIGATFWAIDTDPNAMYVEVSDGTQWKVME